MTTYLLYYLAFINLLLFVLMGVDKAKAKHGARRFPEDMKCPLHVRNHLKK